MFRSSNANMPDHDKALALIIGMYLTGLLPIKLPLEFLTPRYCQELVQELIEAGLMKELVSMGAVEDLVIAGKTYLDESTSIRGETQIFCLDDMTNVPMKYDC